MNKEMEKMFNRMKCELGEEYRSFIQEARLNIEHCEIVQTMIGNKKISDLTVNEFSLLQK